jgi:hypothetical protein
MRTVLFSSAAAALLLMAAPQFAAAQAAPSDTSVRNPDAQVPVTKALSPTGRSLDDANSAPTEAASIAAPAPADSAAATDLSASASVTPMAAAAAPAAAVDASATVTTSLVTNGPVADTPENRAKYGSPLSNAGKRTAARGN